MHLHECEAAAVDLFLESVQSMGKTAGVHWKGRFCESKAPGYSSEFIIAASNGAETKEAYIPLFDDGECLHDEDSLRRALSAAVNDTALAVAGAV